MIGALHHATGHDLPKFNAQLYAFNMKNRFREFYSDKVDVSHATEEADPAERLTPLDLARRVAFLLHEGREELRRQQEQQKFDA